MLAENLLDFPFSWRGDQLPTEVEELRSSTPVRRARTIAGDEAWLVSSYDLCKQVLEDSRFSLKDTSAPGVPRQYALTIPPEVVNNWATSPGPGCARPSSRRSTRRARVWRTGCARTPPSSSTGC